jgi:hypothetical protein
MAIAVALASSQACHSLAVLPRSILRTHLAQRRLRVHFLEQSNDMKSRHRSVGPLTATYICLVAGFLGLF